MGNMLLISILVLGISSCAQSTGSFDDPSTLEKNEISKVFGEKCENAKNQLDRTVQEGQLSNLRHLKRNIELHCVWRRN